MTWVSLCICWILESLLLIRILCWQARREKISERMKILQDLVPGCNKVEAFVSEIMLYILFNEAFFFFVSNLFTLIALLLFWNKQMKISFLSLAEITFMKRILEQIHVVRFDNVWINFKEFCYKSIWPCVLWSP